MGEDCGVAVAGATADEGYGSSASSCVNDGEYGVEDSAAADSYLGSDAADEGYFEEEVTGG